MSKVKKFTVARILVFAFLALWTFSFAAAFFWLIVNSLKTPDEYVNAAKAGFFPRVARWQNYIDSFVELERTGKSVGLMVFNSLWRVLGSLFLTQLSSQCMAYVLAKYKFPGRDVIYWIIIVTMMIPVYGTMPARLRLEQNLHMYNTPLHLLGAIGLTGLVPYSCYKSLSWTYAEAAFIEGAGHAKIFFKIMLPQMIPLITALSVTGFIGGWNDYMDSIVYMEDYATLATGLYIYEKEAAEYGCNYPCLFAGLIMSVIPALAMFVAFQNTFLEIDISGGLKG